MVSEAIKDPDTRRRIAWQSALIIEAVRMHKVANHMPLAHIPMENGDAELRTQAKLALMQACEGGVETWDALRTIGRMPVPASVMLF